MIDHVSQSWRPQPNFTGSYQIGENAITFSNGDGSNSGVTHTFSNGRIDVVSTYPGLDGSDVSVTMVFQKE